MGIGPAGLFDQVQGGMAMIVYFCDKDANVIGTASSSLPKGLHIQDASITDDVEEGQSILEFYLVYDQGQEADADRISCPGNQILWESDGRTGVYTIIDTDGEQQSGEIFITAESAGLSLLNTIAEAYTASEAHSAAWYILHFASASGFEIGKNEISNLTRRLTWDSECTVNERILSIATQFDNAEISYSFDVKNMAIRHKYINIHKKRGAKTYRELFMGKDVKAITKKRTIRDLATAIKVTGGTDSEGNIVTLNGYSYDDDDIYLSGTTLYSRSALKKWGVDGRHVIRTYSYETTSQSQLCNRAVSNLKKVCDMQTNYEVTLFSAVEGIEVGDTVRILNPGADTYLEARVLVVDTRTDGQPSVTLGDYLIK